MPHRDAEARLRDILAAAREIERFTAGMDFAAFAADRKTVLAVLYSLVVIGEAARHVPDDFVTAHAGVPWLEMQRMRNVVAHRYFAVRIEIVWETVRGEIPALIEALEEVLARIGG